MRKRTPASLVLVLVLVAGCGGSTEPAGSASSSAAQPGGGEGTPAGSSPGSSAAVPGGSAASGSTSGGVPADLAWIFETPLSTIDLSTTLDATHRTQAAIPLTGGSLTTTGADGTTYRLDVPGDALIDATTIAMTPLASIDGLPFGWGQGPAVRLEPEGLSLANFATLTIKPASDLPIDQQILFGYHADGTAMSLALPVVDSREIRILVDHFSGYGVSKGVAADIAPVRERLGGALEDRMRSAMAEELQRERQRQLLGGEEDWTLVEEIGGAFREYIDKILKPRIAAAAESCAAGRLALQSALTLQRQAQLLGAGDIDDEVAALTKGLFGIVAEVCMKEEYELCAEQHIVHRVLPVELGIERQMQLLGAGGSGAPDPAWLKAVRRYVERCLKFDLVFESTVAEGTPKAGFETRVKATVPMRFSMSTLKYEGSAPLVNEEFTYRLPGCSVTAERGGGTFDSPQIGFEADPPDPQHPLGSLHDIWMSYFPGKTTEAFTVKCPGTAPMPRQQGAMWTGMFIAVHGGEMVAAGGFEARDWEIFNKEYFAKKEWTLDRAALQLVEVGTMKIYHRPG